MPSMSFFQFLLLCTSAAAAALVESFTDLARTHDQTTLQSRRIALASQGAQRQFARDGVVMLRGAVGWDEVEDEVRAPSPLGRQGCPLGFDEVAGVEAECKIASALACSLLRCSAVRDPIGPWGTGYTHAADHYAYSNVIPDAKRTVTIVLPREPVTLTLRGYPESIAPPTPFTSSSHTSVFSAIDDDWQLEKTAPPPEPELDLDVGDAIAIRGDLTEAPGGLGAAAIVYHFAACEETDSAVLYHSPAALARAQLEVSV